MTSAPFSPLTPWSPFCTTPCQGSIYLQYQWQHVHQYLGHFGGDPWPWFVSFRSHVEVQLSLKLKHSAEVTKMSGLSGLIYSWLLNNVCQEAQTICIFISFSKREPQCSWEKSLKCQQLCYLCIPAQFRSKEVHCRQSVVWSSLLAAVLRAQQATISLIKSSSSSSPWSHSEWEQADQLLRKQKPLSETKAVTTRKTSAAVWNLTGKNWRFHFILSILLTNKYAFLYILYNPD